ncbi:MAG: sigma-54-dependent Fis family transcriptional regulator [Candidatus Wallbacteria bacterium]|nr:sigma-54-dependent Fis family transcriptional regulator [Candidatus Wallbacteria bacterium]
MTRVLVIDDLESARSLFTRFLGAAGYDVDAHAGVRSALESVRRGGIDIVLTDLKMPGMDGLQGLQEVHAIEPELPVIVVTAFATVDTAVEAMRLGAVDYIKKPFEPEEVKLLIERALKQRDLARENVQLKERIRREALAGVVARSGPMRAAVTLVQKIAPADVTVLITGETGTGKDRIARLLHSLSRRADHPFVSLNCCAIAETLLESELFGHVKGAFSGASSDHRGFLAEASGGTLFLDEIGDLALALQPKLLRVLQSGEYYPVGSHRLARCEARILCATNQELGALVTRGGFRADLFYRINVVTVPLPPLRDRPEDIPALAAEFLAHYSAKFGAGPLELSAEVVEFLQGYPWPGNVRQLENVIERSVLVATGNVVRRGDLPAELLGGGANLPASQGNDWEAARDAFEKAYLSRLLEAAGGSIASASRMAGVHRATLYKWLTRHGLQKGGEA